MWHLFEIFSGKLVKLSPCIANFMTTINKIYIYRTGWRFRNCEGLCMIAHVCPDKHHTNDYFKRFRSNFKNCPPVTTVNVLPVLSRSLSTQLWSKAWRRWRHWRNKINDFRTKWWDDSQTSRDYFPMLFSFCQVLVIPLLTCPLGGLTKLLSWFQNNVRNLCDKKESEGKNVVPVCKWRFSFD